MSKRNYVITGCLLSAHILTVYVYVMRRLLTKGGGVVNRHNCRIWGTENPHVLFEKPRVSTKLHVFWCFFLHVSGVIGPYFFTYPIVDGVNYLDMLQMYAIDHC